MNITRPTIMDPYKRKFFLILLICNSYTWLFFWMHPMFLNSDRFAVEPVTGFEPGSRGRGSSERWMNSSLTSGKISWNKYSNISEKGVSYTVKPVYNDHLWDPKFWPLLTGGSCSYALCYENWYWDPKIVVAVDKWSLTQVWLYYV